MTKFSILRPGQDSAGDVSAADQVEMHPNADTPLFNALVERLRGQINAGGAAEFLFHDHAPNWPSVTGRRAVCKTARSLSPIKKRCVSHDQGPPASNRNL